METERIECEEIRWQERVLTWTEWVSVQKTSDDEGTQCLCIGTGGEVEFVSALRVDVVGDTVLVFKGQSGDQCRSLRELWCRWVRGDHEERTRVKKPEVRGTPGFSEKHSMMFKQIYHDTQYRRMTQKDVVWCKTTPLVRQGNDHQMRRSSLDSVNNKKKYICHRIDGCICQDTRMTSDCLNVFHRCIMNSMDRLR